MKKSTRCILKNVAFFVFAGFLLAMTACETTQAQTKKNEMEADVLLEQGKVAFEAGNYEKAFTLFSKSAEQGNVSAQCLVGVMYLGLGDEPNYQKQMNGLQKLAVQETL
ncbi:MAG: hypothetical protein P1P64_05385 [Treponemataceae bacterium]